MLATMTKVDHTIYLHLNKEVDTPDKLKPNETVQFSSKDGEIKIDFPADWPFDGKPHDIYGSNIDQKTGCYTSEILTLNQGDKVTKSKFNCHIKPPDSPEFSKLEYGGEIQPRGK